MQQWVNQQPGKDAGVLSLDGDVPTAEAPLGKTDDFQRVQFCAGIPCAWWR